MNRKEAKTQGHGILKIHENRGRAGANYNTCPTPEGFFLSDSDSEGYTVSLVDC
jgi:hypothetical protein